MPKIAEIEAQIEAKIRSWGSSRQELSELEKVFFARRLGRILNECEALGVKLDAEHIGNAMIRGVGEGLSLDRVMWALILERVPDRDELRRAMMLAVERQGDTDTLYETVLEILKRTMQSQSKAAFGQLAKLVCPDCGGKLLRGPRALRLSQNLTCGICTTRFNVALVTKDALGTAGPAFLREFKFPETDTEFRETAVILSWERVGHDAAGAAFYDPDCEPQKCLYDRCGQQFTGPGLYCCLACAISDA